MTLDRTISSNRISFPISQKFSALATLIITQHHPLAQSSHRDQNRMTADSTPESVSTSPPTPEQLPPVYTESEEGTYARIQKLLNYFYRAVNDMKFKNEERPVAEKAGIVAVICGLGNYPDTLRDFELYYLADPETYYEMLRVRCQSSIKTRQELYDKRDAFSSV